jgi:hypothetical protein
MGLLRIVLIQRETISNSIGEENPKRSQKTKDGHTESVTAKTKLKLRDTTRYNREY